MSKVKYEFCIVECGLYGIRDLDYVLRGLWIWIMECEFRNRLRCNGMNELKSSKIRNVSIWSSNVGKIRVLHFSPINLRTLYV